MPALDYSRVAAIYDDYCVFAGDVELFRSLLERRVGRSLELMAGTGRMSVPLLGAGVALTCLDSSLSMLAILRRKLERGSQGSALVCADVCAIPLAARFDTVVLPFHGLCELVTREEQERALRAVARVLTASGRFVCTTHNPPVRRRTLDGTWHELGEFRRESGGVLRVALRGRQDPATGIVEAQERFELADESGRTERLLVPLRFSLVPASELVTMAEAAGLKLVSLWGDYDQSRYDEATSPVVIATFESRSSSGRREGPTSASQPWRHT